MLFDSSDFNQRTIFKCTDRDMDTLLESFESLKGESIPKWASVLVDSMKALIQEFRSIGALLTKVEKLEDFMGVSETVTTRLVEENKRLQENVEELKLKLDDNEQRSRNGCLVFHGVSEEENENTDDLVLDLINNKLDLKDICIDDIQRSHRLGPKRLTSNTRSTRSGNRPRPIILRFVSYRDREKVFRTKSKLKGTKLVITENLTQRRFSLLQAALTKYGKGTTWTNEGRILTKIGERIVTINSMNDLM